MMCQIISEKKNWLKRRKKERRQTDWKNRKMIVENTHYDQTLKSDYQQMAWVIVQKDSFKLWIGLMICYLNGPDFFAN